MRNFKVHYFFLIKPLYAVQDALALLGTVSSVIEHEYVTGNPRDRSLFGVGTV